MIARIVSLLSGKRPTQYRDTDACVVPIAAAKSDWEILFVARNSASLIPTGYQTGMEAQVFYTNLGLDKRINRQYRGGMSRLKELRLRAGLSQDELAKKTGISQPQIVRLEHPEDHPDHRTISPQAATLLARALHSTVFELTGSLDAMLHGAPSESKEQIARVVAAMLPKDGQEGG